MRIAVIGGGPGGLYFAALAKQLGPAARDHRVGAQRRRRHVRVRRGLLRRDPRRHRARGRRDPPADGAGVRPLGRHRRPLPRLDDHQRRPRLRRDEPQAAAGDPPGALRRARRGRALPHRGSRRRDAVRHPRPRRRRRRPQLAGPRAVRRLVRPEPRPAPVQVHVAGHRQGVRRLQVLRPRDAVRRDAGPRLSVRRPRQHVHRRDERGGLARRPASTRSPRRSSRRGSRTRSRSSRSRSCSPTCSTGTR